MSNKEYVSDLKSTNSKQLLNAYVYDFLLKSALPQTAQSFQREADLPRGPAPAKLKKPVQKELLPLAISLDAPQGFLYEWWQIFWDVFNARTHRGGSENAQRYYQHQLLRQHKEHSVAVQAVQSAGMGPMGPQGANGLVYSPMGQAVVPGGSQELPPQQELQAHFQQQQQLLQKRNSAGFRAQAQAQMQMNHLRQQQFGAGPPQGSPQGQPMPQRASHPPLKRGFPAPQAQAQVPKRARDETTGSPHDKEESTSALSGPSALHDYQVQLLLLERENKKMLSEPKKDDKKPTVRRMPPPKATESGSHSSASTTTASTSSATSSAAQAPAPAVVTTAPRKKPVAKRRPKKKSTSGSAPGSVQGAKSEPPTPTTPLTPNPPGATVPASAGASSVTVKREAHQLSKDSTGTSTSNTPSHQTQLTPPNSENAVNSSGDVMLSNPDDAEGLGTEDHGIGTVMAHTLSSDLYPDFDFSNDISGDGNFNLETFLNTEGGDMSSSFDSYWRDSVEATE